MKCWKILSTNNIVLEENPSETSDFVKVKVTKVPFEGSDCATFWAKTNKKLPIIPGRLATGLVSEADPSTELKKGEKVFVSPYEKKHKNEVCPTVHGVDVEGYLCDYINVPFENVFPLPDGVTDIEASFTEYIATAVRAFDMVELEEHQYVVIVGAGVQGIIAAQLANYYHSIPILIDKNQDRLDLAKELGICYCVNPDSVDTNQRVLEITGGSMADCTLYDNKSGLSPQYAYILTKKGGKIAITGISAMVGKLSGDVNTILAKQLTVIGVPDGYGCLSTAINLLANKALVLDTLVEKIVSFDQVEELFQNTDIDTLSDQLLTLINCI